MACTSSEGACRPMLTAARREALGSTYALVGTHSAVKLCRWQKSMLRGRGGCYKWTMYGIASHRCMEATPSMACANNCVFCWRHNTNPVAASWRWQADSPASVVEGMLASHRALVRELHSVPGVTATALAEALEPRHCALSLVGEPILYPYVNEFVALLHARGMSTFLVNNGQFPDALAALAPVTQLYLSVDAPNAAAMRLLDRPILPDYWARFQASVTVMRAMRRRQRTVFRLTLIDGYNMSCEEHVPQYVDLIRRGRPCFVELKRLTPAFSGNRHTPLRIQNVPTWPRMRAFAQQLCRALCDAAPARSHVDDGSNSDRKDDKAATAATDNDDDDHNGNDRYFVASVHEHSGCILLAHERFGVAGVTRTWIDFDKSIAAALAGTRLAAEDYALPTPAWALADAPGEGFDPQQQRHVTNRRRRHLQAAAMTTTAAVDDAAATAAGAHASQHDVPAA